LEHGLAERNAYFMFIGLVCDIETQTSSVRRSKFFIEYASLHLESFVANLPVDHEDQVLPLFWHIFFYPIEMRCVDNKHVAVLILVFCELFLKVSKCHYDFFWQCEALPLQKSDSEDENELLSLLSDANVTLRLEWLPINSHILACSLEFVMLHLVLYYHILRYNLILGFLASWR
jgi:hypothetical protein